MIIQDELNMVCDLGSMSVYDSNPATSEQLTDPSFIRKVVNKAVGKLNGMMLQVKRVQQEEQDIRPLEAQIIDFAAGIFIIFYVLSV